MDELNQVLDFSEEMQEAEFEKGREAPPWDKGQGCSLLPSQSPFLSGKSSPFWAFTSPLAWQGWEKVLPVKPNPPGVYKVCDSEAADRGLIWV